MYGGSMASTHTILMEDGAGYIGSHLVKNLSGGGGTVSSRLIICPRATEMQWWAGNSSKRILPTEGSSNGFFGGHDIGVVIHFASFIQVGESAQESAKYYANNMANTLNLLGAVVAHEVKRFIFFSSAAVYGEPLRVPIDEDHPKHPLNPYGRSKWIVEQITADFDLAYGFKSVSLRYFNAAGADPEERLGERHEPENHLVPLVNCKACVWLGAALSGA